jgi:hypothetical protein
MILHHYATHLDVLQSTHELLDFQWRNNISTILMIGQPYLFLRAHKRFFWFFLGILSCVAMILAASRGALIFGTLEIVACVAVFLWQCRGFRRYVTLVLCLIGAVTVTIAIILLWDSVHTLFSRFFNTLFDSEKIVQESRFQLIFRAKDDFLRNPIFGSGLGYSGNSDIYNPRKGALYFYHSAPLQIVGSLGILGVLAYSYQLFVQGRLLFRLRTRYAMTVALSILFLWGMSIVNPGVFAPIPYAMIIPLSLFVASNPRDDSPKRDFNAVPSFADNIIDNPVPLRDQIGSTEESQ